jgi:outer membrane receptor protein involved in Fe transport
MPITRPPAALTADSLIRTAGAVRRRRTAGRAGRSNAACATDRQDFVLARMFSAPDTVSSGGGVAKSALSPKLALGWPLGDGYRLRGSLGTGFSPPPASQLYNGYLGAGSVTLANPGLKPERSATADLALSHSGAFGDWSLTLFATRWQDKIAVGIVDYGMPVVQQPQNVGRSSAQGVEAQWSAASPTPGLSAPTRPGAARGSTRTCPTRCWSARNCPTCRA